MHISIIKVYLHLNIYNLKNNNDLKIKIDRQRGYQKLKLNYKKFKINNLLFKKLILELMEIIKIMNSKIIFQCQMQVKHQMIST